MHSVTYHKEKQLSGICKQEMLSEIEKLNQKFRLIDQKLSTRIDSIILEEYQHLENDITFSLHSFERLHSQHKEKQVEDHLNNQHDNISASYVNYLISD